MTSTTMSAPSAGVAAPLAEWAAGVRWETVPAEIQRKTRAVWLDIFGCMLLGTDHPETQALRPLLEARAGAGATASAVGTAPRLQPLDAVLLNGLASGVDLFDGGNVASRGHVSGYVFAAALTAAELCGASFTHALTSFLVGYEVAARIGAGSELHVALHPSGTWNTIGAAAAVGHARAMSAPDLQRALELAANMTLATSWDAAVHGATVRDLYHPLPNYLGMLAADLASVGFTGGPRSVEVTFGQISGPRFDPEVCLAGLGETWLIEANYMKPYPNCRNFQASLDALLDVRQRLPRPFDLQRDRVRIGADPFACRDNRGVHNESALAARESMPVSLAMGLLFGAVTPQMYRDDAHRRPEVLAVAESIEVAQEVPRPFPYARPGWAEISQDGVVTRAERVEPAGNPGTPFSAQELRAVFAARTGGVLGAGAEAAADAMLDGDPGLSLRDVMRWMAPPVTSVR